MIFCLRHVGYSFLADIASVDNGYLSRLLVARRRSVHSPIEIHSGIDCGSHPVQAVADNLENFRKFSEILNFRKIYNTTRMLWRILCLCLVNSGDIYPYLVSIQGI